MKSTSSNMLHHQEQQSSLLQRGKKQLKTAATALMLALGASNAAFSQTDSSSQLSSQIEQAENVPNYIGQVRQKQAELYPEYTEYFRPIFDRIDTYLPTSKQIMNEQLMEGISTYDELIPTENDKRTMILIATEMVLGKTHFAKKVEVLDPDEDVDRRAYIANETMTRAAQILTKRVEISRKQVEISRKEAQDAREELVQTVIKSEQLMEKAQLSDVAHNVALQDMIKWYQETCQRI